MKIIAAILAIGFVVANVFLTIQLMEEPGGRSSVIIAVVASVALTSTGSLYVVTMAADTFEGM